MTAPRFSPLLSPLAAAGLLASAAVLAGPGAHGPNGEHLDTPTTATATAGASTAPRLEAQTELFELVARLGGGELSLLIDRFASNEPLLGATVEVASGSLKAQASFHADHGDYAVTDPALLKLLATPGDHALVISVLAGSESDLLDGVLHVAAAQAASDDHGHEHGHGRWRYAAAAAALALALAGAAAWRWRAAQARSGGAA
jgi:hypothetical protein